MSFELVFALLVMAYVAIELIDIFVLDRVEDWFRKRNRPASVRYPWTDRTGT